MTSYRPDQVPFTGGGTGQGHVAIGRLRPGNLNIRILGHFHPIPYFGLYGRRDLIALQGSIPHVNSHQISPKEVLRVGFLGVNRQADQVPSSRSFQRQSYRASEACLDQVTFADKGTGGIHEKKMQILENPSRNQIRYLTDRFPVAAGETAAFIIAKEKSAVLATDDGIAIKMCKIFGVRFATAIHFLVEMRNRKALDDERALAKLGLLQRYGRYTPEIIKDATERIRRR